jgi:hypothetical protein
MRIVDVPTPGEVLDRLYSDVLTEAFPLDELVTLDSLREGVQGGTTSIAAILDPEGVPRAAAVCDWSPDSRMLLLSYLAVRTGQRGGGYGAALLEHAQRDWFAFYGARALLAEIEHPAAHHASVERGDPVARLRFYSRHGGRALNLPYFQPPVRPGGRPVYGFILATLATGDGIMDSLPAEPLRAFLSEYFDVEDGSTSTDPAVSALWRGLDQPDGIPLLALDEPDRVPVSTKDGPVAGPAAGRS